MSQIITSQNLDEIVKINKEIKSEIERLKNDFIVRYNLWGVTSHEKLAFKILKDKNLVQIPINDKYWGGAVMMRGSLKIPVINTAQPRVYQYFVAWHEIYHLLYDIDFVEENHNIPAEDMEMNERKADYFAANMIFGNVYKYFYSIEDDSFINKVIRCIDVYKAPYKAVLIQLYEEATTSYNDMTLREEILAHFDEKPSNLIEKFQELELDPELVKPSYIISFSDLGKKITQALKEQTDVSYHEQNYDFLLRLKKMAEKLKGELAGEH